MSDNPSYWIAFAACAVLLLFTQARVLRAAFRRDGERVTVEEWVWTITPFLVLAGALLIRELAGPA